MLLRATCELTFEVNAPTPMLLMLRPRSGAGQWVASEKYVFEPHVPAIEYTDNHGNLCQRLVAPQGTFVVHTRANVNTATTIDVQPDATYTPVEDLPDNVLTFLLPSRYCESDKLGDLAQELVVNATPGYEQVEAIRAWIHANVTYQYQTSDASTSAVETAQQRTGVCRDFAHLGIALCGV